MGHIVGCPRSRVAAGGGFSPSDIAGLDWWLEADSISGNDGDAVTDWLDISGAAKHYGQNTTSEKPVLKKNIVNGHAVVRFTTDDRLAPDPNGRTLSTANTMVLVGTPTTTSSSYIFAGDQSQGIPAFISGFSSKSFEYFNPGSERATFAASTSGFHILTVTRTDDTGNAVGYLDGTQVFSIAVSTSSDWAIATIVQIGSFGGINFYSGDIAEILHWPSVLSGADLTSLHSYLKTKYGIA